MGWLSKLFRKPPSFPIWFAQQGDISVQDGLDRYIGQFMSITPTDFTSNQPRTIDELTRGLAIQRAEVTLLEQCRTFYGEDSMHPEFEDMLSTKKVSLQMAEDLLELKLSSQRTIRDAMERVASANQSASNSDKLRKHT